MTSSAAPPVPRGPSFWQAIRAKLIVSLALGAVFAWIVARGGVPIVPPRSAFTHVAWWAVPAYLATMLVTHTVRATRWRFLIAPVKQLAMRDVIALNWIGFLAIFALPLRLGEVARPALSKIRNGVPVSAGFGTIAVERVLDGIVTSLCVAWALFALPRHATNDPFARHLPLYGYASLAVFVAALAALVLFLWKRQFAMRLVASSVGLVSKPLGERIAEKVGSVADGVRSIGSARLAAGFLIESLAYWGCNALGMWVLARGCGLELGFGHATAIMGILAIGILLPAGPGLFGNFQFAVSAALKLYVSEDLVGTQGAVYIFLLYVTQASFISVAGIVPMLLMKVRPVDLVRIDALASLRPPPPPPAAGA